jgi:hypothetical protein
VTFHEVACITLTFKVQLTLMGPQVCTPTSAWWLCMSMLYHDVLKKIFVFSGTEIITLCVSTIFLEASKFARD